MEYSLEKWDTFVANTLLPDNLQKKTETELAELVKESAEEKENLRRTLTKNAFSFRKEKEMELYVQMHQAVLVRLLDKLDAYRQETRKQKKLDTFYIAICNHLLSILNFIEHYFTKYFNQYEKVPSLYLESSLTLIEQSIVTVKEQLTSQLLQTEATLCRIVLNDIEAFFSNKSKHVTYRELIYYKALLDELNDISVLTGENEMPLCKLLFYLNFNSNAFIGFLMEKIKAMCDEPETFEVKFEKLTKWQKLIHIAQTKPDFALHANFPSVKQSLLHVLEQEIKYLKVLNKINSGQEETNKELSSLFIHTPFKGVEVYLFLRSLIDSDAITNHTYSSFFEMLAPFIHNKQQKGFVSTSMIKYSDKIDDNSKDNVKRLLQKMIRNIESY